MSGCSFFEKKIPSEKMCYLSRLQYLVVVENGWLYLFEYLFFLKQEARGYWWPSSGRHKGQTK